MSYLIKTTKGGIELMNNYRSLSRCLLLFVVLVFVFTGCAVPPANSQGSTSSGSSSPSPDTSTPTPSSSENAAKEIKGELKFWGAVGEASGPKDLIDAFMEKYPGVKVEYIQFPNNDSGNTKVNTALLSNDGIDIVMNYGVFRAYGRAVGGMLEELDPYIQADGLNMKENFGYDGLKINGKIYTLPASTLKHMIFINKTALEEAGLPMPPDDWTWEDYNEYARKLAVGSGSSKRFGTIMGYDTDSIVYPARGLLGVNYFYTQDGKSNFDNPAFRYSLELIYQRQVVDKSEMPSLELIVSKANSAEVFFRGDGAMYPTADTQLRIAKNLKDYPRNWVLAFAPMPRYDKNTTTNYHTGKEIFDQIGINNKSNNKDAAWEFIKFAATEGSINMLKYGRGSAWIKLNVDDLVDILLDEETKPTIDMESFQKVFLAPTTGNYCDDIVDAYAQLSSLYGETWQRVVLDEITIDEAVEYLKTRGDQLIEEAKK